MSSAAIFGWHFKGLTLAITDKKLSANKDDPYFFSNKLIVCKYVASFNIFSEDETFLIF